MSFLIDTDLLSLLERKRVPAKAGGLGAGARGGDFSECRLLRRVALWTRSGSGCAPARACPLVGRARSQFAGATEALTEPILVRWKELLADLKSRTRTMTCEDSLIAATALF